ncbi:MAG: hypothetical protein WA004_01940 [Saprospiraceae bacterium]|nr:hypothetical protein [Leptospiraceae bacterium]
MSQKNKIKKIKILCGLLYDFAPGDVKEFIFLRNAILSSEIEELENPESVDLAISESLIELNNIYELIDERSKALLTAAVCELGYRFPEAKDECFFSQESRGNDADYWDTARQLLPQIFSKDFRNIPVSTEFRGALINNIIFSFSKKSYYLARLILYGVLNKENLLDFVFYNAMNKKESFELFLKKTDEYGMTFLFNLHSSQLPSIKKILNPDEQMDLIAKIDLCEKLKILKLVSREELEKMFPKSFKKFSKINPFI